jgi:hypothetical protein
MSDQPDSPFAWWRAAIVISLMGMAFTGGGLIVGLSTRISALEEWRLEAMTRTDGYDARIRAVEALHASTQADLASIKAALIRIERNTTER